MILGKNRNDEVAKEQVKILVSSSCHRRRTDKTNIRPLLLRFSIPKRIGVGMPNFLKRQTCLLQLLLCAVPLQERVMRIVKF